MIPGVLCRPSRIRASRKMVATSRSMPGGLEGLDDDPAFQVGVMAEERDPERPGAQDRARPGTWSRARRRTGHRRAAAFCNSARASSQDFSSSAAR